MENSNNQKNFGVRDFKLIDITENSEMSLSIIQDNRKTDLGRNLSVIANFLFDLIIDTHRFFVEN